MDLFPPPPLFVAHDIVQALSGKPFVAPAECSLQGLQLDNHRLDAMQKAGFFAQVTSLKLTGDFQLRSLKELIQACPKLHTLTLSNVPRSWVPELPPQTKLSTVRLPFITKDIINAGLLRHCRVLSVDVEAQDVVLLSSLEHLESLHLHLWDTSTAWLEHLSSFSTLHTLHITGRHEPSTAWPSTLCLPKLQVLSCPTMPRSWGHIFPELRDLGTPWPPTWECPRETLHTLRL